MVAILLAAFAFFTPAAAETAHAPPQVHAADDGSVVGRVIVDASPAEVLAVLAQATVVAAWAPAVTDVRTTPRGRCETMELSMRGWIVPMRVQATRCPTAEGYTQQLVDSNVFTTWSAEWTVRATPHGTEVAYRLTSELALPVSRGFVQRKTADSMKSELASLVQAVRAHAG